MNAKLTGDKIEIFENEKLVVSFPLLIKPYFAPIIHTQFDWNKVAQAIREDLKISYWRGRFIFPYLPAVTTGLTPINASAYFLELGEGEIFFDRFSKKTRNEIRQSQKAGFLTSFDLGEQKKEQIYKLYFENMKRHRTPPKGSKFLDQDNLFVTLVYKNAVLAAANIAVISDRSLLLLYSISRPEFWPARVNNFVYYIMIEEAYRRGVRSFDFGGGPDSDASHNHFKIGFGARAVPIWEITLGSGLERAKAWYHTKRRNMTIRLLRLIKRS